MGLYGELYGKMGRWGVGERGEGVNICVQMRWGVVSWRVNEDGVGLINDRNEGRGKWGKERMVIEGIVKYYT